ncbi:MAG TPA: cytidine/deoxycytidylate deaminase family protein [bacterium]|nr:cytidine/deoxycytidylate deaminase family protein [bacterium]HPL95523.1 cytidine/deoxycytidylate deaminase family protein [bacterium]
MLEEQNNQHVRPSWDEYFMKLAQMVGERGTCDRGRAGSVAVKDKRIMATGYVGSPPGMPHCDEAGHIIHEVINDDGTVSKHCVRTIHSEQNIICQAAKYGISLDGCTIYTKMEPCYVCARMLVAVGIKRVVCQKRYHGAKLTRELFEKAGIKLDVLEDELETYKDM